MSTVLEILNSPWAILPEKLLEIQSVYERRVNTGPLPLAEIEAAAGRTFSNRQDRMYAVHDGVAIIPVEGALARKANLFHAISGGASMQLIGNIAPPREHSRSIRRRPQHCCPSSVSILDR